MNQAGYRLVTDLPEAMRPWRDRPVAWANVSPSSGPYRLNAQGEYLYYPDGGTVGYDHPVGQAQFGLGCITSYRTETDPARRAVFLERARAQAGRLIAMHDEARGAWWFPYGFDFAHSVHTGVDYTAPWYSGMAQGEIISLFVQLAGLAEVCAEDQARYMAAADGALASLLVHDEAYPWCVNVDDAGYLWIQEYPGDQPGTGDYTYNGMIFAMFGLYDYYCATGSQTAADLYDASATTMARYFPLLRNSKWHSFYCQTHRIPAPTYHQHHINLFSQLHWQTGSPDFADDTERLVDDFPAPGVAGTIQFEAGSHTLYRFDTAASGAWVSGKNDAELESKSVSFSSDTQAPTSMRRRIQGRGIYYLISAGAYTGWWVGENWSKAWLRGIHLATLFRPHRTVTFPGGSVPVDTYKVSADGTVTSVKAVSFANPSNAPADRRAIVNGRPMFQITAGALTGYWVPAASVTIDSQPALG
ncbi:D-glucuronyl C5-epimerase family protein [Streptomyces wuyuanensis]|uniref:D-glucuronyl C5-epimerase C-terminus n=1 Tax=Streptomyces wuyuanensis TaxID=1196353 RepID=A0A1G9Z7S8_9ACTN|nr:D-glucuronyl C5-epimerase family protein [Streptomyces wuyuanensis]SDN17648.1 D-glucuronyl C5-epimerase C-terminus [Streptomyces wuyuanensis]